jgi:hypothetical protein
MLREFVKLRISVEHLGCFFSSLYFVGRMDGWMDGLRTNGLGLE